MWRNFRGTVGFPRGANRGLEGADDASGSRLVMPWESSPPSPRSRVSGCHRVPFSHRPSKYSASGESSKTTDSMECETLSKIATFHSGTQSAPVIMEGALME